MRRLDLMRELSPSSCSMKKFAKNDMHMLVQSVLAWSVPKIPCDTYKNKSFIPTFNLQTKQFLVSL